MLNPHCSIEITIKSTKGGPGIELLLNDIGGAGNSRPDRRTVQLIKQWFVVEAQKNADIVSARIGKTEW